MNNKKSVFLGIASGFISIFILANLIQFLFYYFWIDGNFTITLSGLNIMTPNEMSKIQTIIIISVPLFYIFSTIEFAVNLLKYQTVGSTRFALLIFILLNVGYLIVNVFYGAFNIILSRDGYNGWVILTRNLEMSEHGSLFFIILIILLLVNYLRKFNKVVLEYIGQKK